MKGADKYRIHQTCEQVPREITVGDSMPPATRSLLVSEDSSCWPPQQHAVDAEEGPSLNLREQPHMKYRNTPETREIRVRLPWHIPALSVGASVAGLTLAPLHPPLLQGTAPPLHRLAALSSPRCFRNAYSTLPPTPRPPAFQFCPVCCQGLEPVDTGLPCHQFHPAQVTARHDRTALDSCLAHP